MVGVGNRANRRNASVIYVGRNSDQTIDASDPKNGYQYLLDVGGYKGREIGDAKSVQEVFADHDSRITAIEKGGTEPGGSVKKSKPKIEYVVGRAIKCSLLTCSSNDRVRYIAPGSIKIISLLVGNANRSLLAKKGDSIKIRFVTTDVSYISTDGDIPFDSYGEFITRDCNSNECTISALDITSPIYRVSIRIIFDSTMKALYVSNVTLGDDGVYVVRVSFKEIPSSFDTVSPYRKFENGIVVNKRLPKKLVFNIDGWFDSEAGQQTLKTYKYTRCTTKWIKKEGCRLWVRKIRHKYIKYGVCNIVVKPHKEKKSCYMQTWVVNSFKKKKKRLQ